MKTIWKGIDWLARAVIRLIGKLSPKLGEACLKLWENTELVRYLLVGVATTLVNYVAYFLATRTAGLSASSRALTASHSLAENITRNESRPSRRCSEQRRLSPS